jgi:hypothetical protein
MYIHKKLRTPTLCSLRCIKISTVQVTSIIISPAASNHEMDPGIRGIIEGKNNYLTDGQPIYLSPLSKYRDAYHTLQSIFGNNFLDTLPDQDRELNRPAQFKYFRTLSNDSTRLGIEDFVKRQAVGLKGSGMVVNRTSVYSQEGLCV